MDKQAPEARHAQPQVPPQAGPVHGLLEPAGRARRRQIFILSPAKSSGQRANLLYSPRASFDLARRLRSSKRASLGEVFSFLSGLYFRGKLTYAQAFARPPKGVGGIFVITTNRGLLPADMGMGMEELRAFSEVTIDPQDQRYLGPLNRDAEQLAKALGPGCQVVFLGSIGTPRYVEPLLGSFGRRLVFPPAFVGRGDMSRGGLLLRATAEGRELAYAPLDGAARHGQRPEKLVPRRWPQSTPCPSVPSCSIRANGGGTSASRS